MASKLHTLRQLRGLTTGRQFSTTLPRLTTVPSIPRTQIFHDIPPLRAHRRNLLLSGQTVGLVPTMGALHTGHLSLVRMAAAENTDVFVSIYVNPTQFGLNEDLASYPKTFDSDLRMLQDLDAELEKEGKGRVSAVFAPRTQTIYPTLPPSSAIPGKGSFVTITPLGELLEGASRPVFFRGVATVCTKLFNICTPDRVYFGQKDVQQSVLIKRLVKDFHVNTVVRIGATEREADGLALSSRNVYLGARRRTVGIVLFQALRKAAEQYNQGNRKRDDILWPAFSHANAVQAGQDELSPSERARFEVDYISLADPETMEEVDVVDETKGAILSGAVKMLPIEEAKEGEDLGRGEGKIPVRLIDNIVLDPVA